MFVCQRVVLQREQGQKFIDSLLILGFTEEVGPIPTGTFSGLLRL